MTAVCCPSRSAGIVVTCARGCWLCWDDRRGSGRPMVPGSRGPGPGPAAVPAGQPGAVPRSRATCIPSAFLSTARVGRLRLHGYQIDTEVTQPVQQPIQVGLVTDLPNENRLAPPGFEDHPVEGGREALT